MTDWQVSHAAVPLMTDDGAIGGELILAVLPKRVAAIYDRAQDPARPDIEPAVQVLEAGAYHYEIRGVKAASPTVEPAELFDPAPGGQHGRFQPGEAVGTVTVAVAAPGELPLTGRIEVRPAKLEDEQAFRSMLRDLADVAIEMLLQGFQPSAGRFEADPKAAPRLLYQQFALLHLLLFGSETEAAFGHIMQRPHRSWVRQVEHRAAGTPMRGTSRLARTLSRPGPRNLWPAAAGDSPLRTLPRLIEIETTIETLDTPANRFLRFALERWRDIAVATDAAIRTGLRGATLRRGLTEVARTLDRLDEFLAAPLFDDVRTLTSFPADNPVLMRAEGYRQLFGSYLTIEAAVGLPNVAADPFLISQRNVAAMYEAWCFLQVVHAVGTVCGADRRTDIYHPAEGGMALGIRQGNASALTWEMELNGRHISLELFFNRTFGGTESWTRQMRPDCSLLIRPRSGAMYESEELDVWLHFDAKYRVEWFARQFGSGADVTEPAEDEVLEELGQHRRADLLKMHAYRDAIHRSAGAFVLFPGTERRVFNYRTEVLPGLGAFPLRPDAAEGGREDLQAFLRLVLEHAADQATQHEKGTVLDRHCVRHAYYGYARRRCVVSARTSGRHRGARRLCA
jgi:hypothetical protein